MYVEAILPLFTPEKLARFVGGDAHIQNPTGNYAYRGRIGSIEFRAGVLGIGFDWMTYSVDRHGNHTAHKQAAWRETADPKTLTRRQTIVGPPPSPGAAGELLAMVKEMAKGFLLVNPDPFNEFWWLIPKNGPILALADVRALGNGPISRLR